MPILSRLDPELFLYVRDNPPLDLADLDSARALRNARRASTAPPPNPRVGRDDHVVAGVDGEPDVLVRVFRPAAPPSPVTRPCVYWIQGGGYVLTSDDMDDEYCEAIVDALQCVVVSVRWRRAPEHPFPAALMDCYAGLRWTMTGAPALGIDREHIVVAGSSSGGGLAAALTLLARDRAEFSVAHQLLIAAMLDDSNSTRSSHEVTDPQVWNRSHNEAGWRAYLGATYGTDRVSPYAAPARMNDLARLPPATILTGELDLFVDENIGYAQRLMSAGVSVELHVYPRAHHGFDRSVPSAAVSRRFRADRDAALRRVFAA